MVERFIKSQVKKITVTKQHGLTTNTVGALRAGRCGKSLAQPQQRKQRAPGEEGTGTREGEAPRAPPGRASLSSAMFQASAATTLKLGVHLLTQPQEKHFHYIKKVTIL